MSEPLHDIDKLFHDGIEGHSEYPAKNVWDKIEAGLDKDTAVTYKKKYKTLKRAAALLLALFLGVIIYEVANRHPGKEVVAGSEKKSDQAGTSTNQKDDNANGPLQKDDNETVNKEQNKIIESPDKKDNSVFEERKDFTNDQPPVVSNSDETKANDLKKDLIKVDTKQKNRVAPAKDNEKGNKQKINNRLVKDNQIDFDITAPGKRSSDRANASVNGNSTVEPSIKDDDELFKEQQTERSASFTLMPAGQWKKDISSGPIAKLNINKNNAAKIWGQVAHKANKKTNNPFFNNRGLSVAVYFSPNATLNRIKDDKPYQVSGSGGGPVNHEEIKRDEHTSFTYSGGVKLSYGVSNKVSVQTGVNYTKSITSARAKDIYADRDNNGNIRYRLDCSSGYTYIPPHSGSNPAPGDKITVSDNRNTISYIGIPLSVEYRISFGKFSLSPSAGAQVNILLKGKTSAVLGKGTPNETSVSNNTDGLKASYFSALAGISGEMKLNKKLSLTIAPSGQFGLSSINKGASVKTRPNYIGLAAGLKLKL